ncbi:MAG: alpha/beta hydrolase family protein [Candidatus Zipacnadales bacterium]
MKRKVLCFLGIFLSPASMPQDVSIIVEDGKYRVVATTYEVTIAHDGCLTSLNVQGAEFIECAPDFPRGGYFWQGGLVPLDSVTQVGPTAIEGHSEKASIRYEFANYSQKWRLTNLTEDKLLYVIVLNRAVKAMADENGDFWQPPVEFACQTSRWYRNGQRLHIAGSTRLWGPWSGDHQVWELTLPPRETREVTIETGPATESEAQRAAMIAAQVPKPPADPEGPMWDLHALSIPPTVYPAEGFDEEGVEAIFFEGPPYRGRPTRVFAWLGVPEVKPDERVPGMVLVHGGGGTAFAEWVRLWKERGYAAIAMDTCGCVPRGSYGNWERHSLGGPPGWGGFGQIDWPRTDQWTYHAVADAILAHSILRTLTAVDPDRIGLTGISWGGYLACIIAGVDTRLRFAVPVYGCGYYLDTVFAGRVEALGEERQERWMRWWDPSNYLKQARIPMLWVTGTNDFAYTLEALQKSYRSMAGPYTLCVTLNMPHGHGGPGENPLEIHVFADSLVKAGPPLAKVLTCGREGNQVWATFEAVVPIVKAELLITRDTGHWQDRKWEVLPATLSEAGKATATLPEDTAVYFLNLVDQRGLTVSTEHQVLRQ